MIEVITSKVQFLY